MHAFETALSFQARLLAANLSHRQWKIPYRRIGVCSQIILLSSLEEATVLCRYHLFWQIRVAVIVGIIAYSWDLLSPLVLSILIMPTTFLHLSEIITMNRWYPSSNSNEKCVLHIYTNFPRLASKLLPTFPGRPNDRFVVKLVWNYQLKSCEDLCPDNHSRSVITLSLIDFVVNIRKMNKQSFFSWIIIIKRVQQQQSIVSSGWRNIVFK